MIQGIEVVAHRGASAHAPEHTFAAYDLALEQGADALELDVRMRDGRLVVLHDRTLERTGREPLALDDVFDRYGRATRWLVELKDPDAALEAATLRSLAQHGLQSRATVQSFDHASLRRVRRLAPEIDVAPLFWPPWAAPGLLAGIRRAARYAAGVGLSHRACTPAVALAASARGLRLRAYTVNDAAEMDRLIGLGVDGLITDFPDRARAAVGAAARLATAA
jgi:glycerophosphoryl diester phosphodiesterase